MVSLSKNVYRLNVNASLHKNVSQVHNLVLKQLWIKKNWTRNNWQKVHVSASKQYSKKSNVA